MAIVFGLVAAGLAVASLVGLHRLGLYLEERDIIYYWHKRPQGSSSYNPLQEFYRPQSRHMAEVQEQRIYADDEGSPPEPLGQVIDPPNGTR